jgi:hypothetical protein
MNGALAVTTSLKILWKDFKAITDRAVRFMCHKRLALHWRSTLPQKLFTGYLDKFKAHQHHIINLHRKHNYLLEQMGNADKTTAFF